MQLIEKSYIHLDIQTTTSNGITMFGTTIIQYLTFIYINTIIYTNYFQCNIKVDGITYKIYTS